MILFICIYIPVQYVASNITASNLLTANFAFSFVCVFEINAFLFDIQFDNSFLAIIRHYSHTPSVDRTTFVV